MANKVVRDGLPLLLLLAEWGCLGASVGDGGLLHVHSWIGGECANLSTALSERRAVGLRICGKLPLCKCSLACYLTRVIS